MKSISSIQKDFQLNSDAYMINKQIKWGFEL